MHIKSNVINNLKKKVRVSKKDEQEAHKIHVETMIKHLKQQTVEHFHKHDRTQCKHRQQQMRQVQILFVHKRQRPE